MIDKSRPRAAHPAAPTTETAEPAPGTLPDFTPVPRHYNRHDGWTPERQRGFIAALADRGSVRAAAHAVNMTPEGAYLLRRHPEAQEFRAAWEAALALGVQRLEDVAMDRALNGVEVPIYGYGAIIGTRTVYNDALLMFLLRNRSPARFHADSLAAPPESAAGKSHLERLKREWRAEWEAERERDEDDVLASIDAKLERMREAALARHNPPPPDPATLAAEAEAERRARLALGDPTNVIFTRPKPPRIPHEDATAAENWLVHYEEGRIGPNVGEEEEQNE